MNELEKKFRKLLDEQLPQYEEQRFLLAVSGGLDSVVLAHLFENVRMNFSIAHCNFTLRGEESDGDEVFVKNLAERMEMTFFSKRFDTREYAQVNKLSIQMAARELRYNWFRELLKQHRFSRLVTAHHRNDQAETFFINLGRGTGIDGLSGMHVLDALLFRPLLPFTRCELERYAKEQGLTWREDSTNATTVYARNKIRHDVIPELEKLYPNFVTALGDAMDRLQDINSYYRMHMEADKNRMLRKNEFGFEFDFRELMQAPVPRLLLYELLRGFGFRFPVVQQMLEHHEKDSGKKFFSHTHRAVISRGMVLITRLSPEDLEVYEIPDLHFRMEHPLQVNIKREKNTGEWSTDPYTATFDAQQLRFPLSLRRWHKGDAFVPLGMKGKKKLSDFFIDARFSLVEKENVWVLCSADQIVWVVGHRIDDRYKVKADTDERIVVSVENSSTL